MSLCRVVVFDVEKFSGTFQECKDYITKQYSPAMVDKMLRNDSLHILYHGGRSASFILEWE